LGFDVKSVSMEKILPLFLGALGAMICCAMILAKAENGFAYFDKPAEAAAEEPFDDAPIKFYAELPGERHDLILELYKSEETQGRVINFFMRICGSREVAETILAHADANDVSPALAFALAWEESRFITTAVNTRNKNGSTDRGLFQLNNQSFPHLEVKDFFDPELSARYGMSHLRYCLDTGGSEIAALAMYNAGTNRVSSTGAPKITLDYVHRILANKQRIETQFRIRLVDPADALIAESLLIQGIDSYAQDAPDDETSEELASANSGRARFILLTPLSGK